MFARPRNQRVYRRVEIALFDNEFFYRRVGLQCLFDGFCRIQSFIPFIKTINHIMRLTLSSVSRL